MGSLLKSKYARARAARSVKSIYMRWLWPAAPNQSSGRGGAS
jgi:hypothetical protein